VTVDAVGLACKLVSLDVGLCISLKSGLRNRNTLLDIGVGRMV